MDDYEIAMSDAPCPFCGHLPLHTRDCGHCDDGFISLYDDDPLWYDEDDVEKCDECRGTGVEIWCPNCGRDPREDKEWARDEDEMVAA